MPKTTIKCQYFGCKNTSANINLNFFRIPVKDQARCCAWLVNIGQDDFSELKDNQINNKRICSSHFRKQDFISERKNKLNFTAVPIPYFEVDDQNDVYDADVLPVDESPISFVNQQPTETANTSVSKSQSSSGVEESHDEFLSSFKPLPEIIIDDITPRKIQLYKKINNQKTYIAKQSKLIRSKRSKISFLKKRKRALTKEELVEGLSEYLKGDDFNFMKSQLLHSTTNPWSDDEKHFALSIYYKSPSVYSLLRSRGFKLPCVSKIREWVNSYNVKSGFSNEVFQKLAERTKTMNEHEKECILLSDEMSIKKGLHYDMRDDVIEGFEDLGPLGRSNTVATHALVFMLRGLKYPWKLPLAYVTSGNATKHSVLTVLIDICLVKLFECGLVVRGMTCDLGTNNAASYKLLGSTVQKPYIYFQNHKIYTFYDVPHLIKSVRNTLLGSNIEVEGGIVKWSDFAEFFNIS